MLFYYYSQSIHSILNMGPKSHTMCAIHRAAKKKEYCISSMKIFHQVPLICSVYTILYWENNGTCNFVFRFLFITTSIGAFFKPQKSKMASSKCRLFSSFGPRHTRVILSAHPSLPKSCLLYIFKKRGEFVMFYRPGSELYVGFLFGNQLVTSVLKTVTMCLCK